MLPQMALFLFSFFFFKSQARIFQSTFQVIKSLENVSNSVVVWTGLQFMFYQ